MALFNIENLTKLAHDRNDEGAWQSLWAAVFSLPSWYALGDAQSPNAPMALVMNGQATLVVFTDETKARTFLNKGYARGAVSTIRMDLPAALTFLNHVATRGVTHILFNASPTVQGFGYGLAALSRLASVFGVVDPAAGPTAPPVPTGDSKLDALVSAFAANPSDRTAAALFSYVYELPAWHLLARDEPGAANPRPLISMFNGAPVLMAFTSEGLARASASARDVAGARPAGGDGGGTGGDSAAVTTVLSLPVAEAIGRAEDVMGLHGIVFNDGSQGFFAPSRNLRPMLDLFLPSIGAGSGGSPAAASSTTDPSGTNPTTTIAPTTTTPGGAPGPDGAPAA